MAVLTPQALLGLALFKCLCGGLEKTSLSAVWCTQHRQRYGALTLPVLKMVTGRRCLSGENLSSLIAIFSQPGKTAM